MKIQRLVFLCLPIFLFQTSVFAQLLYNNGVNIAVKGGVVVYVDGSVQNQSGQINVDNTSTPSELVVTADFTNNSTAGGNGYYRINGNWINNNTFNAGTGTVFLEGGNQLIDGSVSTYFYNLTLDGTGSKTQTINQYCTGVLELNDIELKTEAFGFFIQNTNPNAITMGAGFVSSLNGGFLSRRTNISSTYLFPVGSSVGTTRYRPVEITPTTVTANTYTVRMANVDATTEGFDRSLLATGICEINPLFYHQINRTNGTSAINLDIYYNNTEDGEWEGISNWSLIPDWDIIPGSSSTSGTPMYKASATNWNDFSQLPYALYSPIPIADMTSNSPICEGGDIVLQETGGDAVSWSWEGPNLWTSTDQNPTISAVNPTANGLYSVTVTNAYGCTASDSEVIKVDAAVDATITADGPFCENESAVSLVAVTTGGVWSGPGVVGDTFDPAVAGPGNHTIQYDVDNGSCSDTDTEIFHVDELLDATIAPLADLCETASSITLIAADAGGIWSGTGVSGNTFDPNTAGAGDHIIQYDITNGACSDSDTETIHLDSDVDATITPAGPFCSNDFSLINMVAASVGGAWSGTGITDPNNGTFDPPIAGCGTHIIQYDIINGACFDSDTESIQVDCEVDATITAIGPFCDSEAAVALTAIDAGGTWSGTGVIGSNFNPATAGAGIHNVQYNITNGACSDSDNINVTVNANPSTPIVNVDCTGGVDAGIITVTSPVGVDYEYSIDGTFQSSNVFGPLVNGLYVVTVEDVTSGCTSISSNINLDCGCSNPTSLSLSAGSGTTCGIEPETVLGNTFGGSATEVSLVVTSGNGILDQTSINTSPFDFTYTPVLSDAGTTVTITVTTNNPEGLPCSAAIQTYSLNVYDLPTATAGNSTPVCNGGSLTFNETGGDAVVWTWSGPGTFGSSDQNPTINPISSANNGTYNVTIQDVNGCTATDDISITVNDNPTIIIGSNSPICEGSDLNLTETGGDATGWTWTGPNSFGSGDNNPTIVGATPAATGTYSLVVTDANGCSATDNVLVQVDAAVDATINAIADLCESASPITLTATDTGGTWSGTSVTGNSFDPSVGAGDYVITYNISNGACSDSDTETIHVDSDVDATITPIGPFCETDAAITLTAVTSGGTWTGNGITGTDFSPIDAGDGIHNIQYNITNGACFDSDNINITVNQNPNVPVVSLDCTAGEDLGVITITSPIGTDYQYDIGSGYQTAETFGPLTNGNYTITVQDVTAGCISQSALINLDCGCANPPTLVLSSTTGTTCGTAAVTVASNNFGGGATLVDIVHNGAGSLDISQASSSPFSFTYTPDATDIGSDVIITISTNNPEGAPCSLATDSYVLSVLSLPTVTAGSNSPICSGDDLTLNETGGDAINWSWTGPDSFTADTQNPEITGATSLQSGIYTVVVEGTNMCTNSADITVSINENPAIPTASVDCSGGNDNAVLTVTSPLGVNYEYSIGEPFQSETEFTSLANGDYIVTVTDITTTCTSESNIISIDCGCENPPTINLSSLNSSTCGIGAIVVSDNSFGGSATEVSISHNGSGSLSSTSISSSPFEFEYTPVVGDIGNAVTITLTTNNPAGNPCTEAVATFEITVLELPAVAASGNSPVCEGDDINLTESGGDAVDWNWEGPDSFSSIEQNPVIQSSTTSAIGIYTVTATGNNGCTASDDVNILVVASPNPTIIDPGTICSGSSIIELAAINSGGTWSGTGVDETTGEFDPITAGIGEHEIIYTIGGPCGDADTITISVIQTANATIINPVDTMFITDPAIILTATDNGGLWTGVGVDDITGEFNPAIADIGDHEIIYTINQVCGSSDTIIIVVIPEPIPELVIPDVLTPNNDGYNDTWRIQGIRAFENVEIVIFNRWGDEVFEYSGTGHSYHEIENQFNGVRNGIELPFGTYVYLLELDNDSVFKGTLTIIR
ncbi:MAG: gliding motility-associated C-terminal domain-containing protein [Bacteroidales bacterium]|nr:gliding motility-associated C-terminal domain-containing protein [Bacteroidales bacterium]